jgi:large subunit ribosomal protein L3
MRSGMIAEKVGMTRIFDEKGSHIPVTVLKVGGQQVVSVKTKEKDGYTALQLGFGEAKAKNVAKPQKGLFAKAKVSPKKNLIEFRVSEDCLVDVGSEFSAEHFVVGQFVDVSGTTIGHGFSGGMKRWNFRGLEDTHGVSVSHRSHGSTGQCQDPGRVFPGKKMAGHDGAENVTVQNLEVVATDAERGLIMVKGGVPGFDGSIVTVVDAVKKPMHKDAPVPAGLKVAAAVEETEAKPEETQEASAQESKE